MAQPNRCSCPKAFFPKPGTLLFLGRDGNTADPFWSTICIILLGWWFELSCFSRVIESVVKMISVRAGNGSPGPDQGSSKLQILPLSTARKQTGIQNADIAAKSKNPPSTDCFKAQIAFLPLSLLLWGATWAALLWKLDFFKPVGPSSLWLARSGSQPTTNQAPLSCLEKFPKHHQLRPAQPKISPRRTAAAPAWHPCLNAPNSLSWRDPLK